MNTKMRRARGFSLLEVMLAIVVLAVGTMSVLMVFGTALSFAHRRGGQQQLAQVREEALSAAKARVNQFRAPVQAAAPVKRGPKDKAPSGAPSPAGAGPDTQPVQSKVFAAYSWSLHFEPVQPNLPEAGWKTTVIVRWGDNQEHRESTTIVPDLIPADEFDHSSSYAEEVAGKDKGKAAK